MNTADHPVEQLPDLLAEQATAETAGALHAHLAQCAECSAHLTELEAIADALEPEGAVEPAPATLGAILSRLDQPDTEPPGLVAPPPLDLTAARAARRRNRRPATVALLAAAAVILAFVVVAVSVIDGSDDEPRTATPPQADGDVAPPGDSPELVLLAAVDATEALETVRFAGEGSVLLAPALGDLSGLETELLISAEGALAAPDRMTMSILMEASGPLAMMIPDSELEQVAVGDETRTRQDGGPWREGVGEMEIDLPNLEEPARMLQAAAEEADALTDGGTVLLDGTAAREVSFTITADLVGLDALLDPDTPVDMTVYIMDNDRLARTELRTRGTLDMFPGELTMELVTDYFDHDEPVDIQLP